MTKRIVIGTLCFLVSFFIVRESIAQSLGNVIGTEGLTTYRIAAEYNYIGRIVDESGGTSGEKFETTSHRFFIKGNYGLSDFAGIFLKLGAANLKVPTKSPGFDDYNGDTHFAYGGGIKLRPIKMGKSGFFLIGQAVAFTSEGSVQDNHFRINNKYEWREYQSALAFATQIKKVDLYLGLEKTWLDGKHSWTSYLLSSNEALAKDSQDFSDDQQSLRPVIGLDFQLPQNYSLSFEIGGIGKDEVTLMLGFSQKSLR